MEKVRHQAFDLVIFDLQLRDARGLDLLKSIKKYTSDIVGIVITGNPELTTTIESIRQGVFAYLAKPFDLDEIYNAVTRLSNNSV